jgi:hypothetical protein
MKNVQAMRRRSEYHAYIHSQRRKLKENLTQALGTRLYSGWPGIQWRELHREKFECTAVEEREQAAPHIYGDTVADQGMGMLRVYRWI